MTDSHAVRPVGRVRSPLTDRAAAPKQADEGAPPARIEIDPAYAAALDGLAAGADVLVLTWLDRARRCWDGMSRAAGR